MPSWAFGLVLGGDAWSLLLCRAMERGYEIPLGWIRGFRGRTFLCPFSQGGFLEGENKTTPKTNLSCSQVSRSLSAQSGSIYEAVWLVTWLCVLIYISQCWQHRCSWRLEKSISSAIILKNGYGQIPGFGSQPLGANLNKACKLYTLGWWGAYSLQGTASFK